MVLASMTMRWDLIMGSRFQVVVLLLLDGSDVCGEEGGRTGWLWVSGRGWLFVVDKVGHWCGYHKIGDKMVA